MRISSRFERKYHLDLAQSYRVRNALRAFLVPDSYSLAAGGLYLVRSLYYDSIDFSAFHERNNGNYGRIKLRIRSYTDSAESEPGLLVEIKTRKGAVMEKYSSFVPYSRYRHFLKHSRWLGPADPVLIEFERLYRSRCLRPQLLVQYLREGYRCREGRPIRITLDHNISSTRASELFPDSMILKAHRPKSIVLEIKTSDNNEPAWLKHLVREHGLKMQSNSKYVQGIEIVRPLLVTELNKL